jgi:hypothetical protein
LEPALVLAWDASDLLSNAEMPHCLCSVGRVPAYGLRTGFLDEVTQLIIGGAPQARLPKHEKREMRGSSKTEKKDPRQISVKLTGG